MESERIKSTAKAKTAWKRKKCKSRQTTVQTKKLIFIREAGEMKANCWHNSSTEKSINLD